MKYFQPITRAQKVRAIEQLIKSHGLERERLKKEIKELKGQLSALTLKGEKYLITINWGHNYATIIT
jgi:hypothetical protein